MEWFMTAAPLSAAAECGIDGVVGLLAFLTACVPAGLAMRSILRERRRQLPLARAPVVRLAVPVEGRASARPSQHAAS